MSFADPLYVPMAKGRSRCTIMLERLTAKHILNDTAVRLLTRCAFAYHSELLVDDHQGETARHADEFLRGRCHDGHRG